MSGKAWASDASMALCHQFMVSTSFGAISKVGHRLLMCILKSALSLAAAVATADAWVAAGPPHACGVELRLWSPRPAATGPRAVEKWVTRWRCCGFGEKRPASSAGEPPVASNSISLTLPGPLLSPPAEVATLLPKQPVALPAEILSARLNTEVVWGRFRTGTVRRCLREESRPS